MGKERSIKSALSSEENLSEELFQKRVLDNRRLVAFAIKRMESQLPSAMTREDAIQYGMVGLIVAGKTYQEDKGRFSTWAYITIRAHLMDGMMEYMPLNRTLGRSYSIWKKIREDKLRDDPWIEEEELSRSICRTMNISLEKEKELRSLSELSNISLERMEAEKRYLTTLMEASEEVWDGIFLKEDIRGAIRKLTPVQREIVIRYFYQRKSYRTIAEELNLSRRTCRREYERALVRLRRELKEYGE